MNCLNFQGLVNFFITLLSLILCLIAQHTSWAHSLAIMTSELAMGLNIIHLIFFFPKYTYVYSIEWDQSTRTDSNFNKQIIQLSFVANILPILLSSLNLKMSYICFLEEDSKWILLFGLIYIPLNWTFLYTDREGLEYFNYPFLNWQDEEVTFLFLFGQALF